MYLTLKTYQDYVDRLFRERAPRQPIDFIGSREQCQVVEWLFLDYRAQVEWDRRHLEAWWAILTPEQVAREKRYQQYLNRWVWWAERATPKGYVLPLP